MRKKFTLVLLSAFIIASQAFSQMTIGAATAPNAASVLDLSNATNLGLYPPQVNLTATNSATPLTSPPNSILVYNLATAGTFPNNVIPGYYYNAGSPAAPNWVRLLAGNNNASVAWLTLGNNGNTSPAVPGTYGTSTFGATDNWIGNIDAKDFAFGTSNIERMRIKSTGNIGIGTATPLSTADIAGSIGTAITSVSAAATLNGTYNTVIATPSTSAAYTITLPASATANRRIYLIVYNGASGTSGAGSNKAINIAPAAGEAIYNNGASLGAGVSFSLTFGSVQLQTDGSGKWYIINDVSSAASSSSWLLTGNSGTTAPVSNITNPITNNFIGTTDNTDFAFATDDYERMRILKGGQINMNTPGSFVSSDLLTANGSATYLYPVNGYANQSAGAGIYGSNTTSGTAIMGVQGNGATGLINGGGVTNAGAQFSGLVYGSYSQSDPVNSNGAGVAGLEGYGTTSAGNGAYGVFGTYDYNTINYDYGVGVLGIGYGGNFPIVNDHFGVVGSIGTSRNGAAVAGYAGTIYDPGIATGVFGSSSSGSVYAMTAENSNGNTFPGLQVTGYSSLYGTAYLGIPNSNTGLLSLYNTSNGNTASITSGATTASYTMKLPTAVGAANQALYIQSLAGSVASMGWTSVGAGTVTTFSAGTLAPLFTTGVTNAGTTPALAFTLSNAAAYTLFGNNTNAAAAPNYFAPTLASALFANQGTTTAVLHGNGTGNPSWGAVNLSSDVANILPVANGGTGVGTLTAYAPLLGGTTATGALQQATTGMATAGYVLTSNGSGALPTWQAVTSLTGGTPGTVVYANATGNAQFQAAAGTAGDVLISNGASAPTWGSATSTVVTANNGLSMTGGNVQLGGNPLIANTNVALAGYNLAFTGTGNVQLGAASASTGNLQFYNSSSALGVSMQAGNTTGAYTMVLPTSAGTANQVLTVSTVAGSTLNLGWSTPSSGTLGQSATTVYGTGQVTITAAASPTAITGLTQTVTVPASSTVVISTNGGLEVNSSTGGKSSATYLAIYVDGVQVGNSQLVEASNYYFANTEANWSLNLATTLTAASHTIAVYASGGGGTNSALVSSGTAASGLQGQLTVQILKN